MKQVFVFGSNLAGIHGAGAALFAKQNHGAIQGQGIGLQGNSYAIPTKDHQIKTLPISEIKKHVNVFITFAIENPKLIFNVTRIGCGLAGYKNKDIAPLFLDAKNLKNVNLPEEWKLIYKEGP